MRVPISFIGLAGKGVQELKNRTMAVNKPAYIKGSCFRLLAGVLRLVIYGSVK